MEIDLATTVAEVQEDMTLEKKAEIKQKIRWVADQIGRFEAEGRKLDGVVKKNAERLQKAQDKLAELRKGNWNILSQIKINEQEPETEAK